MAKKKAKGTGVRVTWSKRPVTLVERGPSVSLVKWDDSKTDQAIPNDQLEFDDGV